MINLQTYKNELTDNGFAVINNIFSEEEIKNISEVILNIDTSKDTFRKSEDLFAIRQFLKEIPEVKDLIFNENLRTIIREIFGENYFVIKSIYFDKPEKSNWYVAYHQDLTISVDKKLQLENFGPWTTKQNQVAVQPPLDILENIFTIRIHLDDTDENNGALKVIPKSHAKGIYRSETIDWTIETETMCNIEKGGIMLMKPLLLHGSNRTTNGKKRRVIHIEFSDRELPEQLQWSERMN
ncbi:MULTISPECIES: phytanoyl-CoA dioxygenase family protein [Chryseobacterium]|uniref:Phytanoyl-CoA dioxygenase (PhyH) n=1 Tax=Chryseobacterium taihuense TaxID=1141221 RepID=A0A4U8WFN9_9FLAO|nr:MULTISPECIES: phytanoyl-CoA dioxygenase family protein [Chryseobacterium]QQV01491.1 phytanoyl-CoA dioxygenase family protein [Chryseobacterium sp. FDAARGOS 1104]VFB05321.1 Phytanoyl-CoA dioxygenase (PhyH) [Chryseobacterium taihuense]